ncbi:AIPR family protein [Flavobacterium taihuense]|uniref:AIPR family protein n=1 Tax=Flavobacterium taihuense TaxID=2857508 RepID=A0ABS6Y2L8_9FLAO|nr:AIPR family protein [Flavobacterium taihuense]MBW4362313.1 AIPR family protein [Flavobacterium taihuense]
MIIEEYFNYRSELLDQSKDDDGQLSESLLLSQVLPSMLDAKLIDSEDYNSSYFKLTDKMKINAYCVNESGERLQLFLIDESSIDLTAKKKDLQISTKASYDAQFKRGTAFINNAIKGHLNDEIQDSSPARALISQISSSEGADQFDVIELFLISATATVSLQGAKPQPKRIEFENEGITISYSKNKEQKSKTFLIKKRLIDLNFLYNIIISQGNREALKVDFEDMFGYSLQAIKAADESNFESYLCALPATIIADLYKEFSGRLLEKNVRSFLQLTNSTNKGIRETIRLTPEKFVAYNNGLTITATSAEIVEELGYNKIKSLTNFQIVNGGQTTATIYFSQKDGYNIDKVKVMAKINVAKETSDDDLEELISNISKYSNAQSRVSPVDLRSRNSQLVKIKALSESIVTPSGLKWFFERAKGEYNTMLRIAGANKARYKKDFPNERRFSKEQLAKYYSAWGDKPYMVKKGGEKVFRYFIEEISGEGTSKKAADINRIFYEELISKIIIFKKLEALYGQGKNSMGQLRSAVVPYSISVLYNFTDGNKKEMPFDLLKIWMNEDFEDDLNAFFKALLLLMNDLIKKYSKSEDFGEYSKKIELWHAIINSDEVQKFMTSDNSLRILEKYSNSKKDADKKLKLKIKEVDFKLLNNCIKIHSKTPEFYKKINSLLWDVLTDNERNKLSNIAALIQQKDDLTPELVSFEENITTKIRISQPEIFDDIQYETNAVLEETFNYIIKKYNSAVDKSENIITVFEKAGTIAKHKGIKYDSVFSEIGKTLNDGFSPTTKQIYYASYYVSTLRV